MGIIVRELRRKRKISSRKKQEQLGVGGARL